MAEMLDKEFSRKSFVKGGGALIVGLSATGAAQAANDPKAALPSHTGLNPGTAGRAPDRLVDRDPRRQHRHDLQRSRQPRPGHAERAADDRRRGARHEHRSAEVGRRRLQTSPRLRRDSRQQLDPLGRPAGPCGRCLREAGPARARRGEPRRPRFQPVGQGGVVTGGTKTVTYGALIGDKLFNAQTVAATLNPGQSPAKQPSQYTLVGTSPPRIDIPDKVSGKFTYVQNARVPGMLHARVVRPRGQASYGVSPKPLWVDTSTIKHLTNVQVLRKNDFIAVCRRTSTTRSWRRRSCG